MPHQNLGYIEIASGNFKEALAIMNEARRRDRGGCQREGGVRVSRTWRCTKPWPGWSTRQRPTPNGRWNFRGSFRTQHVWLTHFMPPRGRSREVEPTLALLAAEQYLATYRNFCTFGQGVSGAVLSLFGGLRWRLGDSDGALEDLRAAVVMTRDQGRRPQLAAALDWSLGALRSVGRLDAAAVLVGALNDGALTDMGNFPLVAPTGRGPSNVSANCWGTTPSMHSSRKVRR